MWLWLGQGAEKQLVQVRATASRIGPTVVQALVPMPSPGRILDWHALGDNDHQCLQALFLTRVTRHFLTRANKRMA